MTHHFSTAALAFDGETLRLLDQRQLPTREQWVTVRDTAHMIELIQGLAIRGAPLLGVAAALELARFALRHRGEVAAIQATALALREARPTAVNLAAMIDRMLRENPGCDAAGLLESAVRIGEQDIAMAEAMAVHGAALIDDGDGLLTICNTGALATVGIGTALGAVLRAAADGKRLHVHVCETRPLLQGARLTAWELGRAGIPHTVICDGAAASVMASGRVRKVLVGADRIAANGDTANKIGTYALAVLASHHRIPFYVVAPSSTVDPRCADGAAIPIEERSGSEVRGVSGAFGAVTWAPATSPVANPAFDVTPRALISGIVLESGLMPAAPAAPAGAASHDRESLLALLGTIPRAAAVLGGEPTQWSCSEFGDGNVNLLFRVAGTHGSLIVKQAVPYLRCVGASWPLGVERVRFEALAMQEFSRHAPGCLPEFIHFDQASSSLVMEYLHPHLVLRKGMVRGIRYPALARHLGDYLARTLHGTSESCLSSTRKRQMMQAFCGNTELCKISEDLIFTDPYRLNPHNRWTSPGLDEIAARFRNDREAKIAILELKRRFLDSSEALIHGDLHTGSIMVTETSTKIIDPEFACCGPAGFDTGLLLANLLLSYVSQPGHEGFEGERSGYQEWVLELIEQFWGCFAERYHELWQQPLTGERVAAGVLSPQERRSMLPRLASEDLDRIFSDTIGFAAAEMIRRILGLAHVEDLEAIGDPQRRARCELQGLALARDLLVHRGHYQDIREVVVRARSLGAASPHQVSSHGR